MMLKPAKPARRSFHRAAGNEAPAQPKRGRPDCP
jgi:hypothetical protein